MYWSFHEEMVREHERQLARHLRRAAHRRAEPPQAPAETVLLRLCRVADDDALECLGSLAGQAVSGGRYVVAEVDGKVVAALSLGGGPALTDPFRRTAHLLPLLELRVRQLAGRPPRRFTPAFWFDRRGWSRA
jgi:hypothetical protein